MNVRGILTNHDDQTKFSTYKNPKVSTAHTKHNGNFLHANQSPKAPPHPNSYHYKN